MRSSLSRAPFKQVCSIYNLQFFILFIQRLKCKFTNFLSFFNFSRTNESAVSLRNESGYTPTPCNNLNTNIVDHSKNNLLVNLPTKSDIEKNNINNTAGSSSSGSSATTTSAPTTRKQQQQPQHHRQRQQQQ